MTITVHLHTILQRKSPAGLVSRLELELPLRPGGGELDTVGDLVDLLEIRLAPDDLLLAVNGMTAAPEQVLRDGDVVHLIPALAGGGTERFCRN
jgi:molybdopterin converting factor small subunit